MIICIVFGGVVVARIFIIGRLIYHIIWQISCNRLWWSWVFVRVIVIKLTFRWVSIVLFYCGSLCAMDSRFSNIEILRKLPSSKNTFHWLSNFINVLSIWTFEFGEYLWGSEISIIVSSSRTIIRFINSRAFIIFIKDTWSISTFTFIFVIRAIGCFIRSRRFLVIFFWLIRRFIILEWWHGSRFYWLKRWYIMNWLWFINVSLNMLNWLIISLHLIIAIISILWCLIWLILLFWGLVSWCFVSWSLILRGFISIIAFISGRGFISWSFILVLFIFRRLVSGDILLAIRFWFEGWINLLGVGKIFIDFKVNTIVIWRILITSLYLDLIGIIDNAIISMGLYIIIGSIIIIQKRVWRWNNIRVSMNCIRMNLMSLISPILLINGLLLFVSLCAFFNFSIFYNISQIDFILILLITEHIWVFELPAIAIWGYIQI